MIETVYIENQIKKHPRTKEILSRFKKKNKYCLLRSLWGNF